MITNSELVRFAIEKLGTVYVMGTNGKTLTGSMINDLLKRNPAGWFTAARIQKVKGWIGRTAADCHGLIEWALRDLSGEQYDTTADGAYNAAKIKGEIGTIPDIAGICVRYAGHVGIYLGNGYVIEARGFDYGTCITKLSDRTWTHWYLHTKITYTAGRLSVINPQMTMQELQAVLDRGGEILAVPGTYSISKTLMLCSNTKLDLSGAVLQQAGKINHILLTASEATTTGYEGVCNIEVFGGTIEGMGKYATKLNLMTLCHAANIDIHDMIFKDVVEFHDIEINSSCNVKVERCQFTGYNSTIDGDDFRECIQLDCALPSALVIVPEKSKWYDGTPCRNITVRDCTFAKSKDRPAPSRCIGNHCQSAGSKHSNIFIEDCTFTGGNQSSLSGSCITLVGIDGAVVKNNTIEKYGRGIQVYAYDKSYNLEGKKVAAGEQDGICSNVIIQGNTIKQPTSTYKSPGVFISSKSGQHKNIRIHDNKIIQSGSMKYAVDMSYVDGGEVVDNLTEAAIKISSFCSLVLE